MDKNLKILVYQQTPLKKKKENTIKGKCTLKKKQSL